MEKDEPSQKGIEVKAVFKTATVVQVDDEEIVIPNEDMARLALIRQNRERDRQEREIAKQKQEALKKETMSELEKLKEKLELKNQMKNKKGKKR